MAVLAGCKPLGIASRTIVERQISHVMISLQLPEHVVSANLSALIDRMKQFGFKPKDLQADLGAVDVSFTGHINCFATELLVRFNVMNLVIKIQKKVSDAGDVF